jgi:hypothetical protein
MLCGLRLKLFRRPFKTHAGDEIVARPVRMRTATYWSQALMRRSSFLPRQANSAMLEFAATWC